MKKTIEVVTKFTIEIEVADDLVTDEYLKDFSDVMFPVDNSDEFITWIANVVASDKDVTYIEGVGPIRHRDDFDFDDDENVYSVHYSILSHSVESEIL